jgi:chemotaxis protein CheX
MPVSEASEALSAAAVPGAGEPAPALSLPPALDLTTADPLHAALLAGLSHDPALLVDGSEVERAGTACLQVLVAAARTAAGRGGSFALRNPSTALRDAVGDLGLAGVLGMEAG